MFESPSRLQRRRRVGWFGVVLMGAGLGLSLSDGQVVVGRFTKIHLTRSHDPVWYWLIISAATAAWVTLIVSLLRTRFAPRDRALPDQTTHD